MFFNSKSFEENLRRLIDDKIKSDSFSALNIIYGENGQGKSSFMKAYKERMSGNGNIHCLLFNREYIKENIMEYKTGKGLKGFVFKGANQTFQEELIKAENSFSKASEEHKDLKEKLNGISKAIEDIISKANSHIQEYKNLLKKEYSVQSQMRDYTFQDLKNINEAEYSQGDIYTDEKEFKIKLNEFKTAKGSDSLKTKIPPVHFLETIKNIEENALNALLIKEIFYDKGSPELEEYLKNNLSNQMIQIVSSFDKQEYDECPLCKAKEGIPTLKKVLDDYKRKMNNKTKEEVHQLITELTDYKSKFSSVWSSLDGLNKNLTSSEDDNLNLKIRNLANEIKQMIDAFTHPIELKIDNLNSIAKSQTDSNIQNSISSELFVNLKQKIEELNEVVIKKNEEIDRYNEIVNSHQKEQKKLVDSGKFHIISSDALFKNFCKDYDEKQQEKTTCNEAIQEKDKEIQTLNDEVRKLTSEDNEAMKIFAKHINHYFPDGKFRVEFEKDSQLFVLYRKNNQPIDDGDTLSEGERNLLALAYFFTEIKDTEEKIKNKTIQAEKIHLHIDDPASSLDDIKIISTKIMLKPFMEKTTKENPILEKIIITTHSIAFFSSLNYDGFMNDIGKKNIKFFHISYKDEAFEIKEMVEKDMYRSTFQVLCKELGKQKNDPDINTLNLLRRLREISKINLGIGSGQFDKILSDNDNPYTEIIREYLNIGSHSSSEEVIALTEDGKIGSEEIKDTVKKMIDNLINREVPIYSIINQSNS